MRYLVILLALVLFGCADNGSKYAQNEMVLFTGNIEPPENAETVLEEEFITAPVPWDKESVAEIVRARIGITVMGEYLQEKINYDSSIRYYEYKFWFEFTSNMYMKLQTELDKRVKVEGAISETGKIIYEFVRRDINSMLEMQRLKISATEKSIEDKANADTLEDMKKIYATIKPLISMVM